MIEPSVALHAIQHTGTRGLGPRGIQPRLGRLATKGIVHRLSGLAEAQHAVDLVISSATRTLRIFEASLADPAWGQPDRIAALERLVRQSRMNSVHIVLHRAGTLERDCPRLMQLLRKMGHAFEIRQSIEPAASASDAFVIADAGSFWHQLHPDARASKIGLDTVADATNLLRRFEQIWQSSEPTTTTTVLGL